MHLFRYYTSINRLYERACVYSHGMFFIWIFMNILKSFIPEFLALSKAESCCFCLSKPSEPPGITTKTRSSNRSAAVSSRHCRGKDTRCTRTLQGLAVFWNWKTFSPLIREVSSVLTRPNRHIYHTCKVCYIEDMTLIFIYCNDVFRKVKVKLFQNKSMYVLVYPCRLRGLVETVQWILYCTGQPLLQRITRLEIMLLDVLLLHFSAFISAENIFSPVVHGSDDTQLVL